MQVRQGSIRPSTIISAFKKSGIWPIDRTVFINDDYAPSIPYSTEAQDFPSLPLDPNNSDSGSESDSTDDSDTELHPSPVSSHQPLQPTSQSSLSLPAAGDTAFPSPAVSSNLPHLVSPTAQPYHDPVLFDRIYQLETQVQRLSGHVKMIELELQNEKRKGNLRDGRASKRRKLNVEARVLTSAEGKRLAAEKEAERVAKMQKKKETEMVRKEKEAERDQQRQARGPDAPFMGSLSSKSKPDLQEIAAALGLSENGTKDALMQRINACFDSNPLLRDGPRFSGLFHRAPRHRHQVADSENTHPTASISPKPFHNTMRNPLATDIVNLPDTSTFAFHYNLIPMNYSQDNDNSLFHSPAAGPSTIHYPHS
jgi:hypothetical protein